ncbi:toprim domain-containing protein [Phenylobacterium sp. LjRoot219]|uniref:toprim domain-containing protein n=1 Tax=Phenylobacterium sp. LjRoot219 TaxID=3342283 RepID=UPI003ECFC36F
MIAHAFGGADWRDALASLRELGLIDEESRLPCDRQVARPPAQPDLTKREREAVALALWDAGDEIGGTLSESYLRIRKVARRLPGDVALRHHGSAPVAVYAASPLTKPAMLAGVRDTAGRVTAIEIVYLDAGGMRARWPRVSRKTVGRMGRGSAVRLDAAGPELLVAEGVVTALSASERLALPAWALLSTGNLRGWWAPETVRRVVIAADRGADGEASAEVLASRLRRAGVRAEVRLPPSPFGDWNDAAIGTTAAGKGR